MVQMGINMAYTCLELQIDFQFLQCLLAVDATDDFTIILISAGSIMIIEI